MAASTRAQVLRLYRALLRESQMFTSYGYRYGGLRDRSEPPGRAYSEVREGDAAHTCAALRVDRIAASFKSFICGVQPGGKLEIDALEGWVFPYAFENRGEFEPYTSKEISPSF
uniref:Uncharacterized protein n=1 Tax=Sphaerodactylus townsendi TaxID=933632 RepID=A0ACB8FCV8_9SAUR